MDTQTEYTNLIGLNKRYTANRKLQGDKAGQKLHYKDALKKTMRVGRVDLET